MRNTTCYSIAGTKFYRLSSKALFGIYGTNLQNIEKSGRRMYWADAGKKFCQVDQAGAEALIVAYLCKEGQFRQLFLNNVKPHVFVAMHLFKDVWQQMMNENTLDVKCDVEELCNTAIPDLKKNPFWKQLEKLIKESDNWEPSRRYYYMAKQVCHSSNYGIKAQMFCLNTLEKSRGKVALKKEQAERFLNMYHYLFPEIREWHKEVEYQVKETRMLYNLLGDPIYFSDDLETESAMKEAYAAVPQSTVGCITRKAFTELQDLIELTSLPWDIVQDNHDSYLVQCPEQDDIDCCHTMQKLINVELVSPRGEHFHMRSEAQSGYNWAPWDEKKNPEGLKEVK